MPPDPSLVREDVRRALQEDQAERDVTAALVPECTAETSILCRTDALLCGIPWVDQAFRQIDPEITLEWSFADGESVSADSVVCRLQGSARSLLRGERVALNFLQLLSAVATRTQQLRQRMGNQPCVLLDTRKTLPGLRGAQKYAVECGGGTAHRNSLADAVLIKENHHALLPDMKAAVQEARGRYPDLPVIVEVETLQELAQAQATSPDVILLDNFSPEQAREAVAQCPDIPLEISGGITESNVADYAASGVARISAGTLTKDVRAIDFSMRLTKQP